MKYRTSCIVKSARSNYEWEVSKIVLCSLGVLVLVGRIFKSQLFFFCIFSLIFVNLTVVVTKVVCRFKVVWKKVYILIFRWMRNPTDIWHNYGAILVVFVNFRFIEHILKVCILAELWNQLAVFTSEKFQKLCSLGVPGGRI